MTSYCTKHEEKMFENTSKTKFNEDGSPKTYWSHRFNGQLCFGESVGKAVANGRAEDGKTIGQQKKHDTMLMCNAMNNATALVSSGVIAPENLEEWFKRILDALETYT